MFFANCCVIVLPPSTKSIALISFIKALPIAIISTPLCLQNLWSSTDITASLYICGISSILANISADEGGDIYAITISHNTNISPASINDVNGRPLNQVKNISDLSGYV